MSTITKSTITKSIITKSIITTAKTITTTRGRAPMNDRTKSRILVLLLMSLALVLSGIELPRDDHPPAPAVSDDGWTVRRASAGGMEHGAVLVRGGLPFAYAPSHDDGR